jgi:hypothetical protein
MVLNPMLGPLFAFLALAIGLTLGILATALALGMMGTGLFAVGDRVVAWLRNGRRWPED